ncbi:hypothetical protein HQ393_04940 [Chitinibacter bivalviorum]|uniref:Scaffolding protein n=1 Tax=Chitinibacter bivalviorum TaxID=2739434 RepID=A0A7H9BGX4_9NEIS|nr:hypothetical protein [Chitinibacter bivalviorum]QLG87652.1 hypothetical protein HQ393_04940 [Chitinibacter bivalviorum]
MEEQAQQQAASDNGEPSIADLMREAAGMQSDDEGQAGESDKLPVDDSQLENGESDENAEQDASEQEDGDELVEIEIDGKKIKVSKDGADYLLRQADYTKKTQALAEERRQAQAETEAARQQRGQYAQQLQQISHVAMNELQQLDALDWNALIQENPQQALQLDFRRRELINQFQQAQGQLQQVQHIEQQEEFRAHQQSLQSEVEQLLTAIPEWKDETVRKAESAQIRDYLLSNGFTQQDVDGLGDHRAFVLLRKAMAFDKLQAKKPEVQNRVNQAPKPLKGGQPVKPTDGRTKGMQNLKTGQGGNRTETAAGIFERMLG